MGIQKVGHTGTLDPFASGLLLICVGPATRLSEYVTGLDKEYEAVARLGVRTDSDDLDGSVVDERRGWDRVSVGQVKDAKARPRVAHLLLRKT